MEFLIRLENVQLNCCQEKIVYIFDIYQNSLIVLTRNGCHLLAPHFSFLPLLLAQTTSDVYYYSLLSPHTHSWDQAPAVLQQGFGLLPGLCRSGLIPVLSSRCIRGICMTKQIWDTLYGTA